MTPSKIAFFSGQDDVKIPIIRRDISGGINNRQHANIIGNTQVESLINADIGVPGKALKRTGITEAEDLGDNDAGYAAFGFQPDGGDNKLMVMHGAKLEMWDGGGGSFTTPDSGFDSGATEATIIMVYKSGGDGNVAMIQNGIDAAHEVDQSENVTDLGTGTDDPPLSLANCFFRGRWWILDDNKLYYSDAYPANYAGAFDTTTNYFNIPIGTERALVALRDFGIVCLGSEEVWMINPSVTPAATDKSEKIIDIGCVANKTAVMVGDDVFFLATDGVRGVFRTQQDKLQLGQSYPLSYNLKTEFEDINWSKISLATAIWFDNKYLIALPTTGSDYNDVVWCYYPALQSWTIIDGWNVGAWAKVEVSGEEKLFYIDGSGTADIVYQAFTGTDDDGTAISYTEVGRKEDMGQPLKKKVGGEVTIRALATGGDITVYASFDDGGFNELGTVDCTGNLIDLSGTVTFPITFLPASMVYNKFPLWSYGPWYYMQLQLTHTDSDDAQIIERTIATHLEEYIDEESA